MKAIFAFVLMASSTAAFAEPCVSIDLKQEQQKLSANKDLNDTQKAILYKMAGETKASQILACAGLRQAISKQDAQFAIVFIEADLSSKIADLLADQNFLQNSLKDPKILPSSRNLYEKTLQLIPSMIEEENRSANEVIESIKRSTAK